MENNEDLTIKERREQKRQEKLARRAEGEIKESKSRVVLWISVVIVIGAVLFGLVRIVKNNPPSSEKDTPVNISDSVIGTDWIRGNANASTTLIEYGDFECPACGLYHPVLRELESQFKNDLRVIFRNYPLPQHANARLAARAAEAAGAQGKFFEMHDLIYEHQNDWTGKSDAKNIFLEYATTLKLNIGEYKRDFESKETGVKIDEDMASGNSYGVNSTPTFYLGNTKLAPKSFDEFKKLIKDEITKKP
ncbi:MAG: thioredoxin domain-containing protein [Candidatus Taylorbacteria bacterium]